MKHQPPDQSPLFAPAMPPAPPASPTPEQRAHPPDPKNDAAPRLGSSGAGVKAQSASADRTRLMLVPPAHANAPAGTSGVAARRMIGHARSLREKINAFIASRSPWPGTIDDEGELALGIKPQTYTPRRGELAALGLIIDSGQRRLTSSGRPAAVWIVAPQHAGTKPVADTEGGER